MKPIFLFVLAVTVANVAYANSDIYMCTNPDGTKTYANTGSKKGCKKVDLPGLTVIPAPNLKKIARGSSGSSAAGDFPTIDNATQKSRDGERKQILEEELKTEQRKLSELNSQYNNGQPDRLGSERNYAKYQERVDTLKDDINRSQQNIEALQREIKGLN